MALAARSARKPTPRRQPVALHVLLYPEAHRMLAHVLETDTVSDGETPDEALRAVEEALQVEFGYDDRERAAGNGLDSPAPTAFWSALKLARLSATSKLTLPRIGEATLLTYRVDEAPRV